MGHAGDIHQDTIFQVLQSHGKIEECIKFAEDVKNYETVIIHYINKQEYTKALDKILIIGDEQTRNDIMLRYSSVLIKKIPIDTLNALRQNAFRKIDIPKLIPAFMNIAPGLPMDEALKYIMDNCIKKNLTKDKTVHNLAIYFLAQRDKPEELLEYLKKEEVRKQEGHAMYFEVDYALNVCK
mmetsp:Transcript_7263/g.6392  ORF Transcript_7263/g.6392 Transcript_7263/m.6392 type:complete len:182 (+) Transcript_7263:1776-2321(+)